MMRSNMGKQVTQGPMKKKKMKAGGAVKAKPVKMQAFSLPTAAGGIAKADDYKGKVLIARFWATW